MEYNYIHFFLQRNYSINTTHDPLKLISLHYQQCVDNMALTSAEDELFAGMLVHPQELQTQRRLRLFQLGQVQGSGKERAWADPEPELEIGH